MITDHAGELGAVYIYHGAKHALLWKKYFIKNPSTTSELSSFVSHHLESEKIHLSFGILFGKFSKFYLSPNNETNIPKFPKISDFIEIF